MKFLVDNAISIVVSEALRLAGHESVHVRELGMQATEDEVLLQHAASQSRILITADTDFAALLASRSAVVPSVIQFRHGAEHRPELQSALLAANLPELESALLAGSIVTIEPTRIRVRQLPLR